MYRYTLETGLILFQRVQMFVASRLPFNDTERRQWIAQPPVTLFDRCKNAPTDATIARAIKKKKSSSPFSLSFFAACSRRCCSVNHETEERRGIPAQSNNKTRNEKVRKSPRRQKTMSATPRERQQQQQQSRLLRKRHHPITHAECCRAIHLGVLSAPRSSSLPSSLLSVKGGHYRPRGTPMTSQTAP